MRGCCNAVSCLTRSIETTVDRMGVVSVSTDRDDCRCGRDGTGSATKKLGFVLWRYGWRPIGNVCSEMCGVVWCGVFVYKSRWVHIILPQKKRHFSGILCPYLKKPQKRVVFTDWYWWVILEPPLTTWISKHYLEWDLHPRSPPAAEYKS